MLVVAVRAKKRGLLNVGARARRERTRMTPHTQARKQFFPKSLLALFFWPSLFVRCDSSQPPRPSRLTRQRCPELGCVG